jgi:hypothetical protein
VFSPLKLRAFSDSLNLLTSLVLSLLHSLRFLVRSRASLYLELSPPTPACRSQPIASTSSAHVRRTACSGHGSRTRGATGAWPCTSSSDTVIGWHRRSFCLLWTWKSRQPTGRPGLPADVRALIRELSTANPLWGAPRIHGELQKLGMGVRCREIIVYALPQWLWLEPLDSLQRSQSSVLLSSSCSDGVVCIGGISGLSATVGWRSIERIAPQSKALVHE